MTIWTAVPYIFSVLVLLTCPALAQTQRGVAPTQNMATVQRTSPAQTAAPVRNTTSAPSVTPTQSATPEAGSARTASGQSVLHVRVIDIVYEELDYTQAQSQKLPHTFVTFQILNVLRGHHNGNEITLSFVGGPSSTNPEAFLMVDGIPLFDVGEEFIIRPNEEGRPACQLKGCARGLLRVIGGRVHTYDGVPLSIDRHGRMGGRTPEKIPEEVLTHSFNGVVVRSEVSTPLVTERSQADTSRPVSIVEYTGRLVEEENTRRETR